MTHHTKATKEHAHNIKYFKSVQKSSPDKLQRITTKHIH